MDECVCRISLRLCRCRIRTAIDMLDRYQGRVLHLTGGLAITDAAELISTIAMIREILSGTEVGHD